MITCGWSVRCKESFFAVSLRSWKYTLRSVAQRAGCRLMRRVTYMSQTVIGIRYDCVPNRCLVSMRPGIRSHERFQNTTSFTVWTRCFFTLTPLTRQVLQSLASTLPHSGRRHPQCSRIFESDSMPTWLRKAQNCIKAGCYAGR